MKGFLAICILELEVARSALRPGLTKQIQRVSLPLHLL